MCILSNLEIQNPHCDCDTQVNEETHVSQHSVSGHDPYIPGHENNDLCQERGGVGVSVLANGSRVDAQAVS